MILRRLASGLLMLGFLLAPGARAEDFRLVDSVVARVDDGVILLSDLRAEVVMASWDQRSGTPGYESALKEMIKRRLLVLQAEKLRMDVPPAEVTDVVESLAGSGYGADAFWLRMAELGLKRQDVERRMREVLLAKSFMTLKRKSTYVPESEVREYYREKRELYADRTLVDARDEIREILANRKYQAVLGDWIETQMKRGRARMADLKGVE